MIWMVTWVRIVSLKLWLFVAILPRLKLLSRTMKNQKTSKIEILGSTFFAAKLTAMWAPSEGSLSLVRRYFYVSCLMVAYTLNLTAQTALLVSTKNFKDFTDIVYLYLTEIIIISKFIITNVERIKISNLKTLLSTEYCLALNEEEKEIRNQYDNFNRYIIIANVRQEFKIPFIAENLSYLQRLCWLW